MTLVESQVNWVSFSWTSSLHFCPNNQIKSDPESNKMSVCLAPRVKGHVGLPTAGRTLALSHRHTLTHTCCFWHFPVFLGLLRLDGFKKTKKNRNKTSTTMNFRCQTVGAKITTTSASPSSYSTSLSPSTSHVPRATSIQWLFPGKLCRLGWCGMWVHRL